RAADHRVLVAVTKAYLDYGFSPEDAALRGQATFATGIGVLHLMDSADALTTAERYERFLDLMLTR
ncbi:TetR family transcriptional regulator, partial [Mycolicibacterium peregrinum]